MRAQLDALGRVVVAYSGGVDSALVAALAVDRLGDNALAITGVSPALAPHLREEARSQATWLGLRHREVPTAELADPAYASNPADRCYACKRELHGLLAPIARRDPSYPEALRAAIFATPVGSLSNPVLDGGRFYIVLVLEERPADGTTIDAARMRCEDVVRRSRERLLMDALARELSALDGVTVFDRAFDRAFDAPAR